jgi:acyl-CoA thioesterase FadM
MARLKLDFPEEQYYYSTPLTVRVTDINGANHLGNDSMISMISEARARFLYEFGVPETAADGTGIIVTDLATTYRAEAHARDKALIAMAKSGFVFYNYKSAEVVAMPDDFRAKFPRVNRLD